MEVCVWVLVLCVGWRCWFGVGVGVEWVCVGGMLVWRFRVLVLCWGG